MRLILLLWPKRRNESDIIRRHAELAIKIARDDIIDGVFVLYCYRSIQMERISEVLFPVCNKEIMLVWNVCVKHTKL